MGFVTCFDVVTMVTDEATKQFSPGFRENQERKEILKQYCEAIDALAKEFGGESFEVDVDDIKMTISIKMECPDMVIQSKNHVFYALSERAISVGFSHGDGDMISVEFVFPSIWEKVV